ncbi:hypothetical protein EDC01DRAFT_774662 [Geopyxis carbonaria]|nr:hypothetical protein EDC01DRAFT_774662 [Geopyxis carbonaria]
MYSNLSSRPGTPVDHTWSRATVEPEQQRQIPWCPPLGRRYIRHARCTGDRECPIHRPLRQAYLLDSEQKKVVLFCVFIVLLMFVIMGLYKTHPDKKKYWKEKV